MATTQAHAPGETEMQHQSAELNAALAKSETERAKAIAQLTHVARRARQASCAPLRRLRAGRIVRTAAAKAKARAYCLATAPTGARFDGDHAEEPRRLHQELSVHPDSSEALATDERGNYVVFDVRDLPWSSERLDPVPANVLGYGYWGHPSMTAVTSYTRLGSPYTRLGSSVSAWTKGATFGETRSALHLPLWLRTGGSF